MQLGLPMTVLGGAGSLVDIGEADPGMRRRRRRRGQPVRVQGCLPSGADQLSDAAPTRGAHPSGSRRTVNERRVRVSSGRGYAATPGRPFGRRTPDHRRHRLVRQRRAAALPRRRTSARSASSAATRRSRTTCASSYRSPKLKFYIGDVRDRRERRTPRCAASTTAFTPRR